MATYDFVVVGSGIAGLSFALRAARHGTVLVLTKQMSRAGSTHLAQGGIASVLDPLDSIDRHIQDTLMAGAGLCRPDVVEVLVSRGLKDPLPPPSVPEPTAQLDSVCK